MVFYQAVDDEIRIVYSQILRQLKFVQMRDKDAEYFLKQRDYELIRLSFEKTSTKITSKAFFKQDYQFKSHNYRQYNQAYYEEVLIEYVTDARVALNYREKFLTNKAEILLVLEMYCKNDYVGHFLRADVSEI
jgi:predicted naringenin-chalcone synthase